MKNDIRDQVLDVAREAIKKMGWELAMTAVMSKHVDEINKLEDAVKAGISADTMRGKLQEILVSSAVMMAVWAEEADIDLSKDPADEEATPN